MILNFVGSRLVFSLGRNQVTSRVFACCKSFGWGFRRLTAPFQMRRLSMANPGRGWFFSVEDTGEVGEKVST